MNQKRGLEIQRKKGDKGDGLEKNRMNTLLQN